MQVVQEWLKLLMKDYNIKSITATGHSLGGGLATLCAYDVALFLEEEWKKGFGDPDFSSTWKTQEKPTVRMVTFAAPRAGNAAFVEHFNSLGIEALRVVNNGDYVPLVPGGCCSGSAKVAFQALNESQVPSMHLTGVQESCKHQLMGGIMLPADM